MGFILGGLFIVGLVVLGKKAGPAFGSGYIKTPPSTVTSGAKPTALDFVCAYIKARQPVPRFLVQKAMMECAEHQDWKTFHALEHSFKNAKSVPEEEEHKAEEKTAEKTGGEPEIIVGKNSPLQGVSNDDWNEFVGNLKTKEPAFKDERHVGAWFHSTKRLQELGMDPEKLGDEGSQYAALESDVKDMCERYGKFINAWAGDVIQLNGQTMSVTKSGLLGLLKCAGIEGAKGWLTNESERAQYPFTTAMFLKSNGLF